MPKYRAKKIEAKDVARGVPPEVIGGVVRKIREEREEELGDRAQRTFVRKSQEWEALARRYRDALDRMRAWSSHWKTESRTQLRNTMELVHEETVTALKAHPDPQAPRLVTGHEMAGELARALGKPVIFIGGFSTGGEDEFDIDVQEILKACPILKEMDNGTQVIADGEGWIVCQNEQEMEEIYWSIVGDDGPTESNPYDGPGCVYALSAGSDGQLLNENT